MFSGTNTVTRSSGSQQNSPRKSKFLCWPARTWLLTIVLLESAIMAGWLIREYFIFDYTCIIFQPNKTSEAMLGPRIIYAATDKKTKRNLKTIEFNSSIPRVITDGFNDNLPLLMETGADDASEVLVVDEPTIMDSDFEIKKRKKRNKESEIFPTITSKKLKKRKKLRRRKKIESGERLTTVESVVLIEQLPLSENPENLGRIKTLRAKTTKIKHIPQNSIASGKIIKKRKKINSSEISNSESRRSPGKRYYSMTEEPTKFRRNYVEIRDSEEFFPTKIRRFKTGSRRRENLARTQAKKRKTKSEENEENEKSEIPKINNNSSSTQATTQTTPTFANSTESIKAGAIGKAVEAAFKDDKKEDKDKQEEDKDKEEDKEEDKEDKEKEEDKEDKEEEDKEEKKFDDVLSDPPLDFPTPEGPPNNPPPVLVVEHGPDGSLVPNKPPGFESSPRENNFKVQLKTFSALALCIARVLLDVWCCGQLVASVPFLLGLCVRSRCLFLIRLMLDALFLVVLFIYTITVIAFTAILRLFVDEMTSDVVFEWLIFGAILAFSLFLYIAIFAVVLRCCELVLNEKQKNYKEKRSKSLLYTEIGSEQLLEAADEM